MVFTEAIVFKVCDDITDRNVIIGRRDTDAAVLKKTSLLDDASHEVLELNPLQSTSATPGQRATVFQAGDATFKALSRALAAQGIKPHVSYLTKNAAAHSMSLVRQVHVEKTKYKSTTQNKSAKMPGLAAEMLMNSDKSLAQE